MERVWPLRSVRVAAIALVAVLGSGCMSSIGPSLATRDEVGPFPRDYERIIRRWIEDEFTQWSRYERLQMRRPEPGVYKPPRLSIADPIYGWYTQVTFHPMSRVNAPVGAVHYAVLLRDDAVVAHQKLLFGD